MELSQSHYLDECSNTEACGIDSELKRKREDNRLRQLNYQINVRADTVKYTEFREKRRSAYRQQNEDMTDEQKELQREQRKLAKQSLRQKKGSRNFNGRRSKSLL